MHNAKFLDPAISRHPVSVHSADSADPEAADGRQEPYKTTLQPLPVRVTQPVYQVCPPSRKHFFNDALLDYQGGLLCYRIVCKEQPSAVANFESVLFPVFQEILQGDVQEFVPYVFQILSLLLELHNDGGVPEPYMALFQVRITHVLQMKHRFTH